MDIRTLRYFVEAVRQQSFTHTVKRLSITQFVTSKMPKSLEDELSCTLLIRDGRKPLLTGTRHVVFERSQAVLDEFSQLESELSDIDHLHKGVLQLSIPPMIGMLMAEPISRFHERYPGTGLKIVELGDLTVQQAVSDGEFDIAMAVLPIEEGSHLTTLPLFNHPLCVLTPRTAPRGSVTSPSPAELTAYPLVIYNEEFALNQQPVCLFIEYDIKPRITVRSGQWDFLAAMVQAGIGAAIPSESVCQRPNPQSFCWIPLQSELRWELGVIWREGVYMLRSAEARLAYSKVPWLE